MCVSVTLNLMEELSIIHTLPLQQWIKEDAVFKFWGNNVDKKRKVHDLRSDNSGKLVHMFSILAGRSRTPAPYLSRNGGSLLVLDELSSSFFLPSDSDVSTVKCNLVCIVSRILTKYITGISSLAKFVPKHILHQYSREMSQKSEVCTLDVLMNNEAEMIDILRTLQSYLGEENNGDRRVVSGGDLSTCERQVGSQRLTRCANTVSERLELLVSLLRDINCDTKCIHHRPHGNTSMLSHHLTMAHLPSLEAG